MRARVLLAVQPPVLSGLPSRALHCDPNVEVVGERHDPIEILLAVGEVGANVVVHTFLDSGELPGICTHLFAEYPELLIIGLSPDGKSAWSCRQTIDVRSLSDVGLQDVLAAITAATVQPGGTGNGNSPRNSDAPLLGARRWSALEHRPCLFDEILDPGEEL